MPWTPLPKIAFAQVTHPYEAIDKSHDLYLQVGDEVYIFESCNNGEWFRGYLVAAPSLLSGLTSRKGQTLEARVFSGVFPSSCVKILEFVGEAIPQAIEDSDDEYDDEEEETEESEDYDQTDTAEEEDSAEEIAIHLEGGKNHITVNAQIGPGDDAKSISEFSSSHIDGQTESDMRHFNDDVDGDTETEASYSVRGAGLHPPAHHRSAGKVNGFKPRHGGGGRRGKAVVKSKPPRRRSKLPAPVPMLKIGDETATMAGEPLVDEIASCLREWHSSSFHELLLSRDYTTVSNLSTLIGQLDIVRRQLTHRVLTATELAVTREKTVWDMVKGNKMLNREIIVRDPATGSILTGLDSAISVTSLQAQMALLDAPPVEKAEGVTIHHIYLDMKAFAGVSSDPTVLMFYLATRQQRISENYIVELTQQGVPVDPSQLHKMQTLFTDISAKDIADEVYLVARVYSSSTHYVTSPAVSRDGNYGTMKNGYNTVGKTPTGPNDKPTRFSTMFANQKPGAGSPNAKQPSNGSPQLHTMQDNKSTPLILEHGGKKFIMNVSLGVGVLDVTRFLLAPDVATEHVMRIFVPTAKELHDHHQFGTIKGFQASNQKILDWDGLVRDIIESRTDRFESSPKADRIVVNLRSFISPDPDILIKSLPTLLQDITVSQKIGFSGAPIKPRSDIYITIKFPIIPRHGVLVHPKTGSFPFPNIKTLQVALEVRTQDGAVVSDCISPASNQPCVTTWVSCLAHAHEAWNETVKLVIPDSLVKESHLFIRLSASPSESGGLPFALAWMPLWNSLTFMTDGEHSPVFYKYDELTSQPLSQPGSEYGGYLSYRWDNGTNATNFSMIRINSYLCSTRFSQDETLLSLLHWKNNKSEDELIAVLRKFVYIPEIEIVKLLRRVFDSLFGLLVERAGRDEFEDLVFAALVTVLNIVYDRRFNLEPIVDDYASNHFGYPFATLCLIRGFSRLLSNPTDAETSKRLRATFKVARHVFRFISIARTQQQAKEAAIGITNSGLFGKDIKGIFKMLEALMENPAPILIGSQTLAVQHFHTWLPELTEMLSPSEILHIAIDFVDSCGGVKGKLVLYKLVLIINFSKLAQFAHPEARRAIAVNTVRWLDPCWGITDDVSGQYRDQVRLCCSVLSTQIDDLSEEIADYVPKLIESYLAIRSSGVRERETFSLLFPKSYPFPSRSIPGRPMFDEALLELSAVLAAVTMRPSGLLDLAEEEMAISLANTLAVHNSILSGEAFPRSWLSVHVYHHRWTVLHLKAISNVLIESFLPEPDDAEKFNMELWLAFFETLLKLVSSDALTLETFPEQKRRTVWKVAGDVREHGAELLRRTWEAIGWETTPDERAKFGLERVGGYQVQYVPGLVGPIVELCLGAHEGLRKMAVEVMQSMVISEWTLSQNLVAVQAEIIDALDRLFKSKRVTETLVQKQFLSDLSFLFEPLSKDPEDPLFQAIQELLVTVNVFLDLLSAVHAAPLGEASDIINTLRLMEFLKDMQKEELFIKYVHQLVDTQVKARNPVEAGLSLQFHSDLYTWDTDALLPPIIVNDRVRFGEETMFERKEGLSLKMISFFEEGRSWDSAIDVYQELSKQYEHVVFDFGKLAKAHRAIARLQENILRGDRYSVRHFLVIYHGMGFPVGLRERSLVVQGNNFEGKVEFEERMKQAWPTAVLLGDGEGPTSVEGQFMSIQEVTPMIDIGHPINLRTRVPSHVKDFLQTSRPHTFAEVRERSVEDAVNGWNGDVDAQMEKVVYVCEDQFPTILKRSEVSSTSKVYAGIVQVSAEDIVRRTKEIVGLEWRVGNEEWGGQGREMVVRDFTAILAKAMEGAVGRCKRVLEVEQRKIMEGIEGREDTKKIEALRVAVLDHVGVLKRCLSLHGKVVGSGGTHETLMRAFERNFESELKILTPLPGLDNMGMLSPPPTTTNREPMFSPMSDAPPLTITSSMIQQAPSAPDLHRTMSIGTHKEPSLHSAPETREHSKRERLSLIFSGKSQDNLSNHHHHESKDSQSGFSAVQRSNEKERVPFNVRHERSRSRSKGRAGSVGSGRRPSTTSSAGAQKVANTHASGSGSGGEGKKDNVVDRMNSTVRRRLSTLGIGRKGSKTNVKERSQSHAGIIEE
ncbi:hypothetical protein TWF173_005970 [Orbilia oligospora]|uniref:Dedicator of cytokinesis n=1 Tax=Orbilia oligospora TaxID=2813651 RepID=A0A7C8VZI8_ORBOL|nr:hypothetical protein TWF970_000078 [Orbilia oligospora]KAF3313462.1 hypothetical protein TWF173_005970 [Orbilia oligospora]